MIEIHTFRTFIRSLCCFSFLSSPPRISLLFFSVPPESVFSTRGARGHAVVMILFRLIFVFSGSEQSRSQSSSAISDRTSPVKLVGENSLYRTLFQASSGNSDSANWPGYKAGSEESSSEITNPFLDSPKKTFFTSRVSADREADVGFSVKSYIDVQAHA